MLPLLHPSGSCVGSLCFKNTFISFQKDPATRGFPVRATVSVPPKRNPDLITETREEVTDSLKQFSKALQLKALSRQALSKTEESAGSEIGTETSTGSMRSFQVSCSSGAHSSSYVPTLEDMEAFTSREGWSSLEGEAWEEEWSSLAPIVTTMPNEDGGWRHPELEFEKRHVHIFEMPGPSRENGDTSPDPDSASGWREDELPFSEGHESPAWKSGHSSSCSNNARPRQWNQQGYSSSARPPLDEKQTRARLQEQASWLVHDLAQELKASLEVQKVELVPTDTGWQLTMLAFPGSKGWQAKKMLKKAKEAIRLAANNSEELQAIGFEGAKAIKTAGQGLGVVITLRPAANSAACWSAYGAGKCPRREQCPWEHPKHLMVICAKVLIPGRAVEPFMEEADDNVSDDD